MNRIVSKMMSPLESLKKSIKKPQDNRFIQESSTPVTLKNKLLNRNVVVCEDNKPLKNKTLYHEETILGRTDHKGELEFYDHIGDIYHKAKFMDKHGHGSDRDKGDIGIKSTHKERFGSAWFRKQQYVSLGEQQTIKMALDPDHTDNPVRQEALNEFKERYDNLLGSNSAETRSDYTKLNSTTLSPKALVNTKKAGAVAMTTGAIGGVTAITILMHGMPLAVAGVGLGVSALTGILAARFAGGHFWRK